MFEYDPTIREQMESRRKAWTTAVVRNDIRPEVAEELRVVATNLLRWEMADRMWLEVMNSDAYEEKKLWDEAKNIVLEEGMWNAES